MPPCVNLAAGYATTFMIGLAGETTKPRRREDKHDDAMPRWSGPKYTVSGSVCQAAVFVQRSWSVAHGRVIQTDGPGCARRPRGDMSKDACTTVGGVLP